MFRRDSETFFKAKSEIFMIIIIMLFLRSELVFLFSMKSSYL